MATVQQPTQHPIPTNQLPEPILHVFQRRNPSPGPHSNIHGPNDPVTTEVAIATNVGLDAYAVGPGFDLSANLTALPANQFQQPVFDPHNTLIKNLKCIRKYLDTQNFHHAPRALTKPTFTGQVTEYLNRETNLRGHPRVVRILIFAGHGTRVPDPEDKSVDPTTLVNLKFGAFQIMRSDMSYEFSDLSTDLINLDNRKDVLAIPILACCYAGNYLDFLATALEDQNKRPDNFVVMVATRADEEAGQGPDGNNLLFIFLESLRTWNSWANSPTWEVYHQKVQALMKNYEWAAEIPSVRSYTQVAPKDAFKDLI